MTLINKTEFSQEQQAWYEKVCSKVSQKRLSQLLFDLTNVHSPTGGAAEASKFMCKYINSFGIKANYHGMSDMSGNVLGELKGSGGGADLLLYAPIDTHLEGDETDLPWASTKQFIDMKPEAKKVGDWIYGLGSSNPKAMVASLTEIMNALIDADIPLKGNIKIGFADGGMPVDISSRNHAGLSNGVEHLLNRGMSPDFCVLMKPLNWVYHEEPGMAWFKIRIKGTLGYAGILRGTPGFRSSIVPAAHVILALEEWLPNYTIRNTSGVIRPDGWISAVQSGWGPERLGFPSATTEIYCDMRINPRSTPADVKNQFGQFMGELQRKDPKLDLDWEMIASVPGGTTDESNWIVQSAMRGWKYIEKKEYKDPYMLGGQTDGSALRRLGIPTVRIGWEWPAQGSPEPIAEGVGGMGATYVPDLIPCIHKIIYTIIDTATRSRDRLGL
jgi:acetylornithine deacetylase/succinyl-diaminopimelate desuccinylase-like protein